MIELFGIFANGREESVGDAYLSYYAAERRLQNYWLACGYHQGAGACGLQIRSLTWRQREQKLVSDGAYSLPPWDLPPIEDHFAHISLDDPAQIAFTASPEHGERDRQTRMRPGKYLAKFYPDLTPKEVAFYAEWWTKGQKPHVPVPGELAFATSPEEIVRVYAKGPHSCMKGMDCVRVYGAGDLAVAYVTSASGKVISRALCWPEKKVVGRIYPNTYSWQTDGFGSQAESEAAVEDLFHRLVTGLGYTSTSKGGDVLFKGARILKISTGWSDYVMPYSDHGGVDDSECGTHFVMDPHGAWDCQQTDGTRGGEDEDEDDAWGSCDLCDDTIRDAEDVSTAYRYRRDYGPSGDMSICEHCSDSRTFRCSGDDVDYVISDNDYIRIGDSTYHPDWAAENAFESEFDDEWYFNDEHTPIELYDGSIWTEEQVAEYGMTYENPHAWAPDVANTIVVRKTDWLEHYVDLVAQWAGTVLEGVDFFSEPTLPNTFEQKEAA